MNTNGEVFSGNFLETLSTNNIRGYATTLDFANLGSSKDSGAKFSQYDLNVDSIAIQLLNSGEPLSLAKDSICYASIKTPNNKIINNPVQILSLDNGSIVVNLKEQCLQLVGKCQLEIVVLFSDEIGKEKRKLISPFLIFEVFASYDNTNATLNEFTVMDDALLSLQNAMQSLDASKQLANGEVGKINDNSSALNTSITNAQASINTLNKSISDAKEIETNTTGLIQQLTNLQPQVEVQLVNSSNQIAKIEEDFKTKRTVNLSEKNSFAVVNNTIDSPISDIEIYGGTIKNVVKDNNNFTIDMAKLESGATYTSYDVNLMHSLIENETYTIAFKVSTTGTTPSFSNIILGSSKTDTWNNSTDTWSYRIENEKTRFKNGYYIRTFTTPPSFQGDIGEIIKFIFTVGDIQGVIDISDVVLLVGEYGLDSIKNRNLKSGLNNLGDTGSLSLISKSRNLFQLNNPKWIGTGTELTIVDKDTFLYTNTQQGSWKNVSWVIPVEPNTDYILSSEITSLIKDVPNYGDAKWVAIRDENNDKKLLDAPSGNGTFNSGNNTSITVSVFVSIMNDDINTITVKNLMICKASENGEYQSYQIPNSIQIPSNIGYGLKSIGDTKDSENKDGAIQRIGYTQFCGENKWQIHNYSTEENQLVFTADLSNSMMEGKCGVCSDTFSSLTNSTIESYVNGIYSIPLSNSEGYWAGATGGFCVYLWVKKSRFKTLDSNGINEYFKENPSYFYYELAKEINVDKGFDGIFAAVQGDTIIENPNRVLTDINLDVPVNIGMEILSQQEQINKLLGGIK